jgi:serine/threonine protein kinase
MEDLTGKQFGHYQIVAPLGEGGMAAVYKAYQPSMERYVAIKVLPRHMVTSEEFVLRFRREAKLLAQLQHPHILSVFDYGEADGYPYIVMPFVQGGTLSELIQKRSLSLADVRRIITQLGSALSYAHARGMIHRDIKPSNVLIDESNNCLLTDFGLARMVEASIKITTSGTVMGTPAYMSPEQGAGSQIDPRSDIYSLGIILYEMVTGRVPYEAETPVAVVFKHIQDPLPSARKLNPNLPESLELILLKALAKNPDDRYQTAEDFVQAIQKALPENNSAYSLLEQKSTIVDSSASGINVQPVQSTDIQTNLGQKVVASKNLSPNRFSISAVPGFGAIALVAIMAVVGAKMFTSQISPTPAATNPVIENISPTNSPMPLLTSTSVPTSVSPTEVSSDTNFRDDFVDQLADGWTWIAEDPSKWSLSKVPGSLQIVASDASFDGPDLPPNILLRDALSGDFEITTSLRFTPKSDFQVAGLVVFQDKGNALQLGRGFCDIADSCVGDGIYFDNFQDGSIIGNSSKAPFHGTVTYLRLRRIGNVYTAYFSEDGKTWTMLGEHAREFSQIRAGLVAAQASTEIPSVFDYFTMNALQP